MVILFSLVGHEGIARNAASCGRPPAAMVLGVRFGSSHVPNEVTRMLWRDAEDTCFVMFDRMIPKGDVKTPRQFKEFADGMQCTVLHERICSVENWTI